MSVREKVEYIQELKGDFPIVFMCEIMNLPRRTYYDAIIWEKSPRQLKAEQFSVLVKSIFDEHNGALGSSQIFRILKDQGVECTQQTVWRHMKKLGLCQVKTK